MSSVYELARSGPEREEGIRQLIANLQAQSRQLTADRDRYAAWLVEVRTEAETLRAERDILLRALRQLWDTYIPSWAPAAALEAGDGLAPAWKLVAQSLVTSTLTSAEAELDR